MNLTELVSILRATGYPVAFSHFDEAMKRPFITYTTPYSSNLMADGKVYYSITNVDIELYTDKKDLQAEENIETILNDNGIPFDWTMTYIESEQVFQKIYEVRLI